MSYTPGPWIYGVEVHDSINHQWIVKDVPLDYKPNDDGYWASIFTLNGEHVAGGNEYQVFYKPEDIALIVAAPELLEALEEIIASNPSILATERSALRYVQAVEKARKVIKKARGEEWTA